MKRTSVKSTKQINNKTQLKIIAKIVLWWGRGTKSLQCKFPVEFKQQKAHFRARSRTMSSKICPTCCYWTPPPSQLGGDQSPGALVPAPAELLAPKIDYLYWIVIYY